MVLNMKRQLLTDKLKSTPRHSNQRGKLPNCIVILFKFTLCLAVIDSQEWYRNLKSFEENLVYIRSQYFKNETIIILNYYEYVTPYYV